MKAKKRNPLCYFALLGVIGFLGVYMMAPAIIVFLLFFFFWGYKDMTPDELFWENVRKSGLRAFAAGMGIDVTAAIFLVVRSWAGILGLDTQTGSISAADGMVTMSENIFGHYTLLSTFFTIQMVVSICTFFFTLMYFRKKEEKGAEEIRC